MTLGLIYRLYGFMHVPLVQRKITSVYPVSLAIVSLLGCLSCSGKAKLELLKYHGSYLHLHITAFLSEDNMRIIWLHPAPSSFGSF